MTHAKGKMVEYLSKAAVLGSLGLLVKDAGYTEVCYVLYTLAVLCVVPLVRDVMDDN